VTTLRAKIETDVISLTTRSIRNVPTIASPPTSSGKSAATRLRKKSSESRKRRGNANSSAVRRSFSTCSLAWFSATAGPPTLTPRLPASESTMRSAASCRSSSAVGSSATAR
jgi:hypothetical protein